MNILILGSSGKYGNKLLEHFETCKSKNLYIDLLVRKITHKRLGFNTIVFDFNKKNYDELNIEKYDIIINCIGEINNESLMEDSHLKLVQKFLSLFTKKKKTINWLQISSVGVYGPQENFFNERKLDENSSTKPTRAYEFYKLKAEELITDYAKNNTKFKYIILRPSQIIGQGIENKSIENLVKITKFGLFFYINDKNSVRNYVHHIDLSRAIYQVINNNFDNNIYIVNVNILLKNIISCIPTKNYFNFSKFIIPYRYAVLIGRILQLFGISLLKKDKINGIISKSYYNASKFQKKYNFVYENDIIEYFRNYK